MLENLDGDILKLRSGHASNDFLTKLNNLRNNDLFLDIDLILTKQLENIDIDEEDHDQNNRENLTKNHYDLEINVMRNENSFLKLKIEKHE